MPKNFDARNDKKKQGGWIVSAELIFVVVILVIGLIVGWVELRNAVIAELHDSAEAIGAVDQSYAYAGTTSTPVGDVITEGSTFDDDLDDKSGFDDTGSGEAGADITVNLPLPTDEEKGP